MKVIKFFAEIAFYVAMFYVITYGKQIWIASETTEGAKAFIELLYKIVIWFNLLLIFARVISACIPNKKYNE